MNKKNLIAVAVSAAFGLPLAAQAQTSVTVFGKLYPQITNIRTSGASPVGTVVSPLSLAATGAASTRQTVMQSSNSRIGFRGTEDLGGGLKALFQLESAFSVDDGTLNATNVLWGQNTFVGLAGGFGTVKLGKMDTPYKSLGDTISFLGVASGNFISNSTVLSGQPWGIGNAHRFHERKNNAIQYESPDFAGFQILAQYALGEQVNATARGSNTSAGIKYEAGPFYVALAHDHHEDQFGGTLNMPSSSGASAAALAAAVAGKQSDDDATRLTFQFKIAPETRVEANVARIRLKETGVGAVGAFREYRHNVWAISGEHKMGPVTLAASYGQGSEGRCVLVGVTCSTAGLQTKQLNLGTSYSLSKRTQLFLIASQFKNDHSATLSNATGGRVAPGTDTKAVALGVNHNF
jgi:predicted porin